MFRSHGRVRTALLALLLAIPLAGAGATLTAPAAGADPTVPGAPRSAIAVVFGSTGAKVSWKAPANDGGSPITGYTVTPYRIINPGPLTPQVFNSPATTATLTGLKAATGLHFKVVATNAVGSGPASAFTGGIVIGSPSQPAKPTVKKVGKGALQVSFKAPKNNGAPITKYAASCHAVHNSRRNTPGGGHASPIIVSSGPPKLIAGNTFVCVVRAYNKRGPSVPSPSSAPVKA